MYILERLYPRQEEGECVECSINTVGAVGGDQPQPRTLLSRARFPARPPPCPLLAQARHRLGVAPIIIGVRGRTAG